MDSVFYVSPLRGRHIMYQCWSHINSGWIIYLNYITEWIPASFSSVGATPVETRESRPTVTSHRFEPSTQCFARRWKDARNLERPSPRLRVPALWHFTWDVCGNIPAVGLRGVGPKICDWTVGMSAGCGGGVGGGGEPPVGGAISIIGQKEFLIE